MFYWFSFLLDNILIWHSTLIEILLQKRKKIPFKVSETRLVQLTCSVFSLYLFLLINVQEINPLVPDFFNEIFCD